MKKQAYYVPMVVLESAKARALALIQEGYVQAYETLECPLCSIKYLFLCDLKDSCRRQPQTTRHGEALLYFAAKIKESHLAGHIEEVIVLPYELHMVSSSGGGTGELPASPNLKAS